MVMALRDVQHSLADVFGDIERHTLILDRLVPSLRRVRESGLDLVLAPENPDLGLGHDAGRRVVSLFKNLAGRFRDLNHRLTISVYGADCRVIR